MKKLKKLDDFNNQSIEKNQLRLITGGYDCATGAGSIYGRPYSADTRTVDDETGEETGTNFHTEKGDKSTAEEQCIAEDF